MKHLLILPILILLIFSLGCSNSKDFTESGNLKAKITLVAGKAVLVRNNKSEPLKAKMIVTEKDIINTYNGTVDMFIPRRGLFKIKPNSTVELSSLSKETRVMVKKGKLLMALQKLRKAKSLAIETPTAVAGVRGTSFLVDVAGQNSKIGVLTGEVEVRSFGKVARVSELKEVNVSGKTLKSVTKMNIATIVDVKGILTIKDVESMKEYDKIKANVKKLEIIEGAEKETNVDMDALRNAVKAQGMEEDGSALSEEIKRKSAEIDPSKTVEAGKKKFIKDKDF